MKVIDLSLDSLIPYARNPRKNDGAVDKVAASIKEFGWRSPIVVDEEMVILAGHTRYKAAKKLGLTDAPVHIAEGLTEAQKRAYRIADNRVAEEAEWDYDFLKIELDDLGDLLDVAGFDQDELDKILVPEPTVGLTDEDSVPEVQDDPISKEGDIWILGRHRLMCGDSTSIDAVEKLMDGMKADLLHTDPPYNVDYSNASRPKAGKRDLGKIKNDVMSGEDFYQFLLGFYSAAFSVLKDGSSAYVWHADRESVNFRKAGEEAGFDYAQVLIWKKPMLLSRKRYQWAHEPCLFMVKGSPFFTDDRTKTTVWDFGGYDKSKNVHPTQKPIFIPEEAIQNSSKMGSNVLDLFGGSGSTLIACEKLQRTAFLMELDPKYCDVIIRRWQAFTGQKAILEATGEPFNG